MKFEDLDIESLIQSVSWGAAGLFVWLISRESESLPTRSEMLASTSDTEEECDRLVDELRAAGFSIDFADEVKS